MTVTTKRALQSATFLACLTTAVALHANTTVTQAYGGTGGATYNLDCGDDAILVGIGGRKGDWIDQLVPICVKVAAGGRWHGTIFAKGSAGAGGTTNFTRKTCLKDQVVVSIHGRYGWYVHRIDLKCLPLGPTPGSGHTMSVVGNKPGPTEFGWATCSNNKPARGFYGKAGLYIDSVGLRCHGGTTPLLTTTP